MVRVYNSGICGGWLEGELLEQTANLGWNYRQALIRVDDDRLVIAEWGGLKWWFRETYYGRYPIVNETKPDAEAHLPIPADKELGLGTDAVKDGQDG